MTRSDLVIAMTVALVGAVLLGWVLRWIYSGLARAGTAMVETVDSMTARLTQAEEGQAAIAAQLAATDQSLRSQLREKQAELDAAMDGLRTARQQNSEWQAAYEAEKARADSQP
ncbi:hypothetical protein SAMN06273572_101552 [Monaibacterium marinum]|uniref:Uncharacterized protein n=1 Tax=Pontivivens marinum TaxID=1690039 RepID=A0A2C9CN21_9RHOB|nr:hypothetical protein [Monaibacterium marinum]SOH92704.1 hypothetical protein SAMN06273572_101552 [Monaibacterium marinum]